jgi:hypothetical protein
VRARLIKPELHEYAPLARCSRDARLVFIGLLNLADDDGNVSLNPAFIRSRLFSQDDTPFSDIEGWIIELCESPGILEACSNTARRHQRSVVLVRSAHCFRVRSTTSDDVPCERPKLREDGEVRESGVAAR